MSTVSKTSLSLTDYHKISFYPSQMDIAINERCNQDCDFCYVNKSNPKTLNFTSIKKAIDIFYSLPVEDPTNRMITFTTTEPLVYPDLYKKTIDYIFSETIKKNLNSPHIVTTTNGISLNKKIRDFILNKIDQRFWLNISLDGKKKSHDVHRRIIHSPTKSPFELSWRNFKGLPKDKVRVLLTVTPSEVGNLRENVDFILKNGFKKIEVFPQMLTLWEDSKLAKLKKELGLLIEHLNTQQKNNYNLRLLNRLWDPSHYTRILLGSDGKFYFFTWVLIIPHSKRKRYIIGDTENGIDLEKRIILFKELFNKTLKESNGVCLKCDYKKFCYCPIPLFLWCHHNQKNFNKYLNNFCKISKIFIDLAAKIKYEMKDELDREKLAR